MLKLYIGNKNYSTWSMRPWVLMRQAGIPFEEVAVRFDGFDAGSAFKRTVGAVSPTGKVPVLVDDGWAVWDSLAIAEYLAEKFPQHQLWPAEARLRARARSACAEMHSGFAALRSACPMSIEARLPEIGALVLRDQPAVRADLDRLVALWGDLLDLSGGPLLCGAFSVADAFFAPVAMRIQTYALPVPPRIAAYLERLCALPGVKAWVEGALAEHDFIEFDEPYRLKQN
ncbi:glutathione S-transferase family protein [Ramlibacter sp. 2FC]|uniref:glutathione S-transferase family protein n=1 Tax=Ramlibacter sp. 2FC TaxID=2502188 RepID=UPI0010F5AEC7|nr:glutathione S-transferase family protein [Ramlibacter sp. 2FC]